MLFQLVREEGDVDQAKRVRSNNAVSGRRERNCDVDDLLDENGLRVKGGEMLPEPVELQVSGLKRNIRWGQKRAEENFTSETGLPTESCSSCRQRAACSAWGNRV